MSVTLPVMTAHMGSRTYYISKMSAASLAGSVAVASELADWETQTLEERFQRALNTRRVEQEIAPYLANAEDRFFSAIIIWATSDDGIEFESFVDSGFEVPAAYRAAAESFGFLTLDRARLVALDGQHRLASLRHVVQGHVDGPFRNDVAGDEITVIFVDDPEVKQARNLFTVLNRAARRVGRNDVLLMGEVDGAAIVARRLVGSELLAPRGLDDTPLIRWERNTISAKDERLTTLNAIYEIVRLVARHRNVDVGVESDDGVPPPNEVLDRIENETLSWLEQLFESCPKLEDLRQRPHLYPDERERSAPLSLLLKPVGLQAFYGGVVAALDADKGGLTDPRDAIRRAINLDWSLDATFWRGVLVRPNGNVSNAKSDVVLASDLLAWVIGDSASSQFSQDLLARFRKQMSDSSANLPARRFGETR